MYHWRSPTRGAGSDSRESESGSTTRGGEESSADAPATCYSVETTAYTPHFLSLYPLTRALLSRQRHRRLFFLFSVSQPITTVGCCHVAKQSQIETLSHRRESETEEGSGVKSIKTSRTTPNSPLTLLSVHPDSPSTPHHDGDDRWFRWLRTEAVSLVVFALRFTQGVQVRYRFFQTTFSTDTTSEGDDQRADQQLFRVAHFGIVYPDDPGFTGL